MAPAPPESPHLRIEGLHSEGIDVTWTMPQQFGDASVSVSPSSVCCGVEVVSSRVYVIYDGVEVISYNGDSEAIVFSYGG